MANIFSGFVGVVIGSIITCLLTYFFQRKLLEQQLKFLKQQTEADSKLREQIQKETKSLLEQIRGQIHGVIEQIAIMNHKK